MKYISILFILFLFINPALAKKTHFKISYDPHYAPFSYEKENKAHGLLIDIWSLWAKENNYTIEFVNAKLWHNALKLTKNKEVDFFLGTEAYEPWMKSSQKIYSAQTSLFKRISYKREFNKSEKISLGLIGEDYYEYVENTFKNAKITIYKDYDSIFSDLKNEKIDLIYDDNLAIKFYILENRMFHLFISLDDFSNKTDIQAISHNKDLIKIFNSGFEKIDYESLLDIEKKWLVQDSFQYENKTNKQIKQLTIREKEFIKNTPLNISVSQSWKPFSFLNNNEADGISSDFWKYFAKELNLNSNYNFSSNFTEQLNSIKEKQNDIIFSTGKTKDRQKYSLFTKAYISFPISIATLKDENFIEDASSLLGKKIAVGENFTAHKMLKKAYPDMNFIFVDSILEGLKKVSKKEAYAYVDIRPNLTYNINKEGLKDVKITGNTGLKFELRIMLRDDYPLLLSALNKTIDNMSQRQKNDILAKWSNLQFEKKYDYSYIWQIFIFVVLIITALIYRALVIQRANDSLKQTIDERTKELKSLNENLENLIKEKTKELRETNEILDEAQKIAHLGSYKYDIIKNTLFWSQEHFKIFDIKEKEVNLGSFLSAIHPDDKQKVLKQMDYCQTIDKAIKFEYRLLINEKIKYIESTMRVKYNLDKKPAFIIGTVQDITSLKTLEMEKRQQENLLAQQSKMAAMGEMLENIAHQWRQPLSLISTSSSSIKLHKEMNILKDDFLLTYLDKITDASKYLSKTIDDFRNFFSSDKKILEFNLKDMLDKCLLILSSKMDNREIELIQNTKDVNIKSLESELIQVIMNLIKNAVDVVENKKGKKLIFIDILENRDVITITIKDNGGGIKDEIINRIFEPYFTTKHKSQGTGIGLYMSLEIITKHLNGKMNVKNTKYSYEDENYIGAQFNIHLPRNI